MEKIEKETIEMPLKEKGIKMVAKKNFVICQNDFYLEIKQGDKIDQKKCKKFIENLKTEKVI